MQVYIRILTHRPFILEVETFEFIEDIEKKIKCKIDMNITIKNLKFNGGLLSNGKRLCDYNIKRHSIVDVFI